MVLRNVLMGVGQIAVGLLLVGNGVFRPEALWSADKMRRIRDNLGDAVTSGIFVAFGVALIVVGVVVLARARR